MILQIFKVFVISRLLILGVIVVGAMVYDSPNQGLTQELTSSFDTKSGERVAVDSWKRLARALHQVFISADAGWYLEIARRGYDRGRYDQAGDDPVGQEAKERNEGKVKNWVFFPLYPQLIYFLSSSFPISRLAAAMLISNLSFLGCLVLLSYYLQMRGYSERCQTRALVLVCFYPTTYFFLGAFTESLFFLLTIGAWVLLEKRFILASSLFIALCTATRPTGILLLPSYWLIVATYPDWKKVPQAIKHLAAMVFAPLGALLFMAYLYQTSGDYLAFSHGQANWGRSQPSVQGMVHAVFQLKTLGLLAPWNFTLLNFGAALVALFGSGYLWFRKREPSLAVFLLIPAVVTLSTGSLQSFARIVSCLFPLYVFLAVVTENPWIYRLILALFIVFLCVMALMFGGQLSPGMA